MLQQFECGETSEGTNAEARVLWLISHLKNAMHSALKKKADISTSFSTKGKAAPLSLQRVWTKKDSGASSTMWVQRKPFPHHQRLVCYVLKGHTRRSMANLSNESVAVFFLSSEAQNVVRKQQLQHVLNHTQLLTVFKSDLQNSNRCFFLML